MLDSEHSLRPTVHPGNHERPEGGLKDHNANRENIRSSPRKPVEVYEDDCKRPGMHKKTKSSVSLKSFIGNDKVKPSKPARQESEDGGRLKRPKSSTGLAALLSRSKMPKESKSECKSPTKDKENRTPPQTADMLPPPIWAHFATQETPEPRKSTAFPEATRTDIEKEIALYTPKEYSPSKQRNFHDHRPTLSRKPEPNPRPLSKIIGSGSTSMSSTPKQQATVQKQTYPMVASRAADEQGHELTKGDPSRADRKGPEDTNTGAQSEKRLTDIGNGATSAAAKVKRGSRVMAAVAAFNGKRDGGCDTQPSNLAPAELDNRAIEEEFETLLVSQPDQQACPLANCVWRKRGIYRIMSAIE